MGKKSERVTTEKVKVIANKEPEPSVPPEETTQGISSIDDFPATENSANDSIPTSATDTTQGRQDSHEETVAAFPAELFLEFAAQGKIIRIRDAATGRTVWSVPPPQIDKIAFTIPFSVTPTEQQLPKPLIHGIRYMLANATLQTMHDKVPLELLNYYAGWAAGVHQAVAMIATSLGFSISFLEDDDGEGNSPSNRGA